MNNTNNKLNKLNKKYDDMLKIIATLTEGNKVIKKKVSILENNEEILENIKLLPHKSSEQDLISEITD